MAEYIKRKDVIEAICNLCRMENDDCSYPRCTIINTAKNIHAADVVERKHGKWMTAMLDHEAFGVRPTAHYCSECHQIISFRTFYCPNCGADMRGDSDV